MRKSLALVLFAVAGCGNNTGAVDDFIHTVAQQQCEWEFRCCTDAEIMTRDGTKYADQDSCVPYQALTLMDQLYVDRLAVSEGRLRVDSQAASDCLIQLNQMACNPAPGQTPPMMDPMAIDPCTKVFVGNTTAGNECIYTNECVDGAHCVSDTLTVGRGVCVPYQHEGDICNGDADCDPKVNNLYCSQADFQCHLRAQLGEACMFSGTQNAPALPLLIECDNSVGSNLYCDPRTNTCNALPGNGQACLDPLPPGATAQCNNDPSLQLTCDHSTGGTSGTCRAPGQQGDDCHNISCATGLWCDSQSGYFCEVLPGFGDSCEQTDACQKPYYCNTQQSPWTCDQPASVGESCAQATCDTGLYCNTSRICATQLPVGSACTSSIQCQSLDCGFSSTSGTEVCLAAQVGVQCIGRN